MKQVSLVLLAWLCVAGDVGADESNIEYRTYDKPTQVQGLTVIGKVEFYPSGTLTFARIAKETKWFGHLFPEGTGLHFRDDGTIDWCFLAQDTEIQGHMFQGGGHEWMTDFYRSGKLKSGGLAEMQVIDGIPCAAGTFWNEAFGGGGRTHFYESGKLLYAKVAKTVQYRGTKIKRGKHVRLSEDGAILVVK